MKKIKSVVIALVVVCPLILILMRNVLDYRYCDWCIANWMGEDFVSYTGKCTGVYYDSGFEGISKYAAKAKYQYLTGQGWHLILDNGKGYYIPEAPEVIERNNLQLDLEKIRALEAKEVTVVCLPETVLPCLNLIVSLEVDGNIYVDEAATHAYIIQAMKNIRSGAWIFLGIVSPLILFGILLVYMEIDSKKNRLKKERQKQEKMQHLREAGKLHPTKQQKKKTRQ